MLLGEYMLQYLVHCCLRGSLVKYFGIPFFACEVIYFGIDCVYSLFIKFAFAGEDCFATCCEQYVVVKRWNKEFSPPIEELWTQIYSRAAAVADYIGKVAVKDNYTCDACYWFYF